MEYAEGGRALTVTGFAYISPEGSMLPGMISVENDSRIVGLRKLTDAVHAAERDAKIFCQIVRTGIWRLPFVRTTYADTFAADETTDPFVQMGGTGETCPAATEEQIGEFIDFAEATAKVRSAVDGNGQGRIPIIGAGGWRTPAVMEKHVGRTCDAFAISRPLINDPTIVNKWIEDPDYLTECVSDNKCLQGQGVIVCRKDD